MKITIDMLEKMTDKNSKEYRKMLAQWYKDQGYFYDWMKDFYPRTKNIQ